MPQDRPLGSRPGRNRHLPARSPEPGGRPVYDSPSGGSLLIPQGARLLGQYDSRIAAGLATVLNLGLERGSDSEDDVARAIREAAQDTIGRTGDEIVRRQLAVPPTLTIRPGFPVRVVVTRDLILEPLGEVR